MYKIYTRTVCRPPGCIKQFLLAGTGFSGIDPALKRKIIMRVHITAFLLFAVLMQVSASGLAQRLTLVQKEATLKQVFSEINKQTGYNVIWSAGQVNGERKVTADFKDAPLLEVLDRCLSGTGLGYTIEDRTVVIRERGPSLLDKLKVALGVPVNVSGKVQDETGQAMPGVTVKIKNTNTGVVTDAKGAFAISVPDDNTLLVFSFIGYEGQELRAKDITAGAVIILKAAVNNLHEVVINKGYYTERQGLSTGNVSTVTAKEIEQQPVANPLAALEGRVPGLVITQTTGVPGGGFNVQIRGKNSVINGTNPLYVIDGVPYNSQLPSSNPTYAAPLINDQLQGGNPLNFINPYDIEKIDVLKDADATSIYGSRAANGAILITTKKGKAGAMKVNFNVNSGYTQPNNKIKTLNTQQYLQMRHEAFKNDGVTPGPGDHDINGDWDTTRYTDWSKVFIQSGHYTDAQGSVSGGTTNTQYLIGGGYYRQTTGYPTLLPNDGADQKASTHFNLTTNSPDKKFKMSLTGSYVADQNTVQQANFTNYWLSLPPDAPALYNPDGSLNWAPLSPGQPGTWSNPLAALNDSYKANTSNLVSNLNLSYEILPRLDVKTNFGYTNTQTDEVAIHPTTDQDPGYFPTSGYSNFNSANSHSWIIEPQIDYKLQMGKGLFAALIGASLQESDQKATSLSASGFTSDALLENSASASSLGSSSNNTQYKYQALFLRLNYNWDDKYLLNLTGRRDGSSRFGPGKQFANFGAIGGAWIFSKEEFIQRNLSFLSFGKLRGSYGITGNDQIPDYQFLDLYTSTYNPYQGSKGLYPSNLFNPYLSWETTLKLEGGIELGFLKDRITIEASFYRNRSGNELVQTPISVVTGYTSIPSNLPATVQNSGKEFVINTVNIKTKSFNWSSSLNLTIARNKLIAFPNLASSPYANTLIIGQPITILETYHYTGVNATTGLYQFASVDGGNTSSPNSNTDRTALLDLTPKFYGGFQNSVSYKGLSLDFLFQFTKQEGKKLWAAYGIRPGTMFNQPTYILNRWQSPGDQSAFQMVGQDFVKTYSTFSNARNSDYAYGDASYIRLKNLAISWQLPENWRKSMHLENCRVYIQGQNLLTFTKYQGIDPETQGYGAPPMRVWTAGLQVGL